MSCTNPSSPFPSTKCAAFASASDSSSASAKKSARPPVFDAPGTCSYLGAVLLAQQGDQPRRLLLLLKWLQPLVYALRAAVVLVVVVEEKSRPT